MAKKDRIRKSLKYSLWDGVFASIQFGLVEQFATPFALFLGAGNAAIGWLNFIRNAFVSVVQSYSADVTLKLESRKKLITACVFIAAALWIPTFILPFLFAAARVPVFILLFAVTSSFNMFAGPAWASLVAEYIPPGKRGKYFGWRGSVLGVVYCSSLFLGGLILHFFHSFDLFLGFALLITIAAASRFVSWHFLTKMHEPKWQVKSTDYFSFGDFLKRFPAGNFIRYSVFSSLLLFGVSLSSPFIPIYLLNKLKFDYLSYTVIMGAAVLTTFVMQQYWGALSDRYGNMKVVKLASFFIAVIPLLWIVSPNIFYLISIQLWGGFIWAGFNLSSTNFIYDVAVSSKRERCIAYYNLMSGLGLGLGALAGGYLYRFLPSLNGSQFASLFLISAVIRMSATLLIHIFVKEVKNVEESRVHMLLLDMSGIRAFGPLGKELLLKKKRTSKDLKI